ncbi:MAG: class I SAM-dependent methyltransferase [Planctomycetota bacterium]
MKSGEPSATARLIAAATIYSSIRTDQSALVPKEAATWCERLLAASPGGRRWLKSVRSPVDRAFFSLIEKFTLPGITRHYQLRKRWIERAWKQALDLGFRQLLVLGAGLDTLTLREAERDPTLRLVEVDHPATQTVKQQAFQLHGLTGRVRLVPADLSLTSLAEALAGNLELDKPMFVVAEGLLMYLDESRVRALMRAVAELPVPRVQFAMTHMDGPAGFTPHSRLVDLWLRFRSEPFRWSASDAEVRAMLEQCGWRVMRQVRGEEIARELGLSEARELKGENIALAEKSANELKS